MKHTAKLFSLAVLIAAASPAVGQGMGMQGSNGTQMKGMGMQGGMQGNMQMKGMGMHMMAATFTDVDTKTGLMDVDAGGMALKLHFPPPALADVKAGDKITVHMGFTKP